jgi:hypothetical protein
MSTITYTDDGEQKNVPMWATESTLQKLVEALGGKTDDKSTKTLNENLKNLNDNLNKNNKDGKKNAETYEKAVKDFEENTVNLGLSFRAGMEKTFGTVGKVLDKTLGLAALVVGTALTTLGAKLVQTANNFATLSQVGLTLNGSTAENIARFNELGMTSEMATQFMRDNAQAVQILGAKSMPALMQSFQQVTVFGSDLGLSLKQTNKLFGDEITLRTNLINLGRLDASQRNSMINQIAKTAKTQQIYSQALGVSTDAMRDFAAQVLGNNEMLMASFLRMPNQIRAQLTTGISEFVSVMRATGGEAGGEIAAAIIDAASMGAIGFSDAAFGFITVLPQLSDNMQRVINDFNSGMINGEQAAMAITNELGNLSDAEKNRVFLLARAGDEQAKAMANAITQFEQSADRMKKQGNTLEGVQQGFQVFQAVIDKVKGQFSAAFNSFIEGFGSVFTNSNDFANLLKGVTQAFQPVVKELFGLEAGAGKTSEKLKDLGADLAEKLLPRIQSFANWVADTIVFLKGYFSQFKNMSIGEILMSMLKDAGSKILEGIKYALDQVPWSKVAFYIAAGITTAFAAIKLGSMLGSALGGLFGLGKGGAGAAAGMTAMAGGLAAFSNPAVALGLGAITLAVIGLAGAFSLASLGFEAFGKMMKSILDGVGPVVESFGIAIKSVFEGIGSVIESVGDSISGIVNSIGNVIAKYGEMKVGKINAEADAMVKTTQATTAAITDLSSLDPQNIMGLATGIDAMGLALESFAETMTPGFLDTIGQGFASLIGADSPVQAIIQLSNEADPVKIMDVAKATMATNAANAGATALDPSLSQNSTDNSSQTNTVNNTTNNSSTSDTNIDLLETLNVLASQNYLQLEALKKSNRILGEISNKQ